MMKKRLAFKCWNCDRKFTLFKEILEEQELIVPCPFCNAEALVKLEPYKKKIVPSMRSADKSEGAVGFKYDFPELIPTQKTEK